MTNQLITETSPYLLQHANNPVDWHPWGKPALDLARRQNKPILLSIGYAACHWCHVMERESFEDPAIAKIMNNHFICIKVDREERPDLDKIYQLAHQMLTQRPGGWPLTIALTPAGHAPFFAGTYFPPESRFNLPGFGELLEKISAHFADNAGKLVQYHLSFNTALEQLNPKPGATPVPDPVSTLGKAAGMLEKQYDSEFGGFGDAPKFPHPSQLELLMAAAQPGLPNRHKNLEMLHNTLTHMAQGGLFDHLGGGFFRYSVDRKWQIPHFEKMLYDNAQLLGLYCDAVRLSGDALFVNAALETAQWVITQMQQSDGGYASTLDADSEGEEGKYYVWNETDMRAILTENEYASLEDHFGLFGETNFTGNWHFNVNPHTDWQLLANSPQTEQSIATAKSKLRKVRSLRIAPNLDDKILTAWNGLMIKGMAKAGRALNQPEFIQSAQRATDFIRNNMWQGNRMLAAYRQGKARLNGYLDDYAFVLDGLIELLQSGWRNADLEFAIAICDAMLERFEDKNNGGFFFTSHDHEKLLYRPKQGADDAIPSGNGAAILALLKLGNLLGDTRYLHSAEKSLTLFADELVRRPSINGLITSALQCTGDRYTTVVIRGAAGEIHNWQERINQIYSPATSVFAIEKNRKGLPGHLALRKAEKTTVAYVCNGTRCTPPIRSLEELVGMISAT